MNAIIVLVLCVTALGTVVCLKPSPRIVGGRDALPGELPWIVSISVDGQHICSGSILDSTHILTAGNCLNIMNIKTQHIKARIGSLDLDKGGVQYDVIQVINHFYIGILCTDKEMVLDSTLPVPTGKVTLSTDTTDLAPGTVVRVAGWGVNTTEGETFTEKLQVVDIPIVGREECQSAYSDTDVSLFIACAGAEGMGACIGDIGDPLILDGVQIGIFVRDLFEVPCASLPGWYLEIKYFVDLINNQIQQKCFKDILY